MNYMRKKNALKNIQPLVDENKSVDEIKVFLKGEKAGYTDAEIEEIIFSHANAGIPEEQKSTPEKPKPTDIPAKRFGSVSSYYRYKVKPVYESFVIRGKREDVLKGYEKIGDLLGINSIESKHAELLNSQIQNTNVYYFLEGQDGFISIDNIL